AGEQPALVVCGRAQVDHARLAGGTRDEFLDALESDLDGLARLAGQKGGDDIDRVEVEAAAEVAPHGRLNHAYPVARDAQRLGQVALMEERPRRAPPHGEAGPGAP